MSNYDDFKIDEKVLVWDNCEEGYKLKRHFAGVVDGFPSTWHNGATSWSINDEISYPRMSWDHWEKAVE